MYDKCYKLAKSLKKQGVKLPAAKARLLATGASEMTVLVVLASFYGRNKS